MKDKTKKRIKRLVVVLVVLGVIYGLAVAMGLVRLHNVYHDLRDDGRPMTLAEVIPEPVADQNNAALLYTSANPYEAMWAQGEPQRALAAMKAWADGRNIRLMVSLWPFLQGLGRGRFYPFEKLHQLVGAECSKLGITCHEDRRHNSLGF